MKVTKFSLIIFESFKKSLEKCLKKMVIGAISGTERSKSYEILVNNYENLYKWCLIKLENDRRVAKSLLLIMLQK